MPSNDHPTTRAAVGVQHRSRRRGTRAEVHALAADAHMSQLLTKCQQIAHCEDTACAKADDVNWVALLV